MVQNYVQIAPSIKDVRRSFLKKGMPESELKLHPLLHLTSSIAERPHFVEYSRKLAGALRHKVLVDKVVNSFEDRVGLLKLLEEHISKNIVKVNLLREWTLEKLSQLQVDGQLYKQVVGIPQGSVLSTLLCTFFYGDLEKRKMRFSEDPNCVRPC